MTTTIRGLNTRTVDLLRAGGLDANQQEAVRVAADGSPSPCRHCLDLIESGADMLVLAHRPFDSVQPWAEIGPIFLHSEGCPRYRSPDAPVWSRIADQALVRGYAANDVIRYDTGRIVPGSEIDAASRQILEDESVAYVHVRSKFNCFLWRVDRA